MATIYQPAGRPNLYIRYKVDGEWKSKATQWRPGQEREAEAEGRRLEGAGAPPEQGKLTVYGWADRWLNRRSERVQDYKNDQSRLEHHVLPVIGSMLLEEVRPSHLVEVVERMKQQGLAPRTIRNTYSIVKAMWRDARIDDLVLTDPCILTARQLGKVQDKNLGWRGSAVFSRDEVVRLLMDERIPFHRRVMYGLLCVGMLRDGEMAGLRWNRVELRTAPLGRLVIVTSYERDTTKTESERWMPIHPALSVLLTIWQNIWAQEYGRTPTPEDLVLPAPRATNRGPRKPHGGMLDKNWVWKRFAKDLKTLGLRHRRVHDLRRTGISLAIEDGADELILKRGTHAPPKHIMGMYTSVSWERLCEEVAKLSLDAHPPKRLGPHVRRVRTPVS